MDYYEKYKDKKISKMLELDGKRKICETKIEEIHNVFLENKEEFKQNEIKIEKIRKLISDYMVAPQMIKNLKKASIYYSVAIFIILSICITLGLKTSFLLGIVSALPAGALNVCLMKFWYKTMSKPYVKIIEKTNINNLKESLTEYENVLAKEKNHIDRLEINLNFLRGKEEEIITNIVELEKDLRILENYDVVAQTEAKEKESKVKKLEIK